MENTRHRSARPFLKTRIALDQIEPIQFARLYRISKQSGLSARTQQILYGAMISNEPMSSFAGADHEPVDKAKEQIELRIRALVSKDASWTEIKSHAWQLFRLQGNSVAAATLVEHVFLYGSVHDTCDVLAILNEEGFEYFFKLHNKLREHLVFSLWKVGKLQTLNANLLESDANERLVDIERLYVFWSYYREKKESDCFIYFQNYEKELFSAIQRYGAKLGFSESRFRFAVGSLAVKLGFPGIGKTVLQAIAPTDEEYADALQLQMMATSETGEEASRSYLKRLDREPDWRSRIELLATFISETRKRLNYDDIHRPAVNEILSNPLKWVPPLPKAWTAIDPVLKLQQSHRRDTAFLLLCSDLCLLHPSALA